ncbi:hypothetical protein [Pollutimonas bauzanensis]|uniref:hypothetical protein n=1 Tax=Pollutimonas bauzanensis TaxID=658167 RepID=UPI001160D686|nr:hypothetical protein [Pollutimonas bauzanensis]
MAGLLLGIGYKVLARIPLCRAAMGGPPEIRLFHEDRQFVIMEKPLRLRLKLLALRPLMCRIRPIPGMNKVWLSTST